MPRPKKKPDITVPDFISQEAKKICYIARKEAGKSILKNQEAVEKLLFARSAGIPSSVGIAGFAKINRNTLESLLKKGETGEGGEAHKLFFDAWNYVKEKINVEILEKYNIKLLNSDPSLKDLKQAIELRMQEYRPAQNVNVLHGDVTINKINNHAEKILSLPPEAIEKFILQETQALGIAVNVNDLKPQPQLRSPLPVVEIIDAEIVEHGTE